MLVIPRSETKMPGDVAICLSHSPEWKNYTASMFDMKPVTSIYTDRSRIPRTRSMSVNNCAALQNQLQALALYPRTTCITKIETVTIKEIKPTKKPKRKVTFADAHGRPLFVEKIFTEAPDEPTQVRSDRLNGIAERLRLNLTGDNKIATKTFEFSFPQPMADYIKFKNKLERDYVALENIICRHRSILGTIKVINMSFDKKICVRMTFDGWQTFEDVEATYIKNAYEGEWTNTFKFTASIPKEYDSNQTIEFCIKYTAGNEYWDNNSGDNYRMVCVNPALLSPDQSDQNGNFFNPELSPLPSSIFY